MAIVYTPEGAPVMSTSSPAVLEQWFRWGWAPVIVKPMGQGAV